MYLVKKMFGTLFLLDLIFCKFLILAKIKKLKNLLIARLFLIL